MRIDIVQDGLVVASVEGQNETSVMTEAMHYAFVYGQDAPVKIEGLPPGMRAKWTATTTDRGEREDV
jgi:hypothetical protein